MRKKRKKGIANLLVGISVLLFSIFMLIGGISFDGSLFSMNNDSTTWKNVKSVLTSHGFAVENTTEEVEGNGIEKAYWLSNKKYAIEYYEYSDASLANDVFAETLSLIEGNAEMITYNASQGDDSSYILLSDGEMCYGLLQKGNCFLYSEASEEDKDELNEVFAEIG